MDRKFRFDFTCGIVAIEIEGGTWIRGGHSTGVGIQRDCEKGNLATLEGWKVFRLTSDMIDTKHVQEIINFCKLHS
jgi:very-short-patch-repair endonuclease